jgi:hypothetical protein
VDASARSARYYTVGAWAVVGVAWACWLAFGLRGGPDRLYLVGLTANLATITWLALLARRGASRRAWLPAIVVASLGLLALIGFSLPERREHVTEMALAGLVGAIAAWVAYLLARSLATTRRWSRRPAARSSSPPG